MTFFKMQGLGNDYIYVDCTKGNVINNTEELAKKLSNRHFGIGADGLILIADSNIADFKMIMYNSDGSQAEMCGNGIRCVGKFVYDNKLTDKKSLEIETLGGIKKLWLDINEKEKVENVTVDMGEPIVECLEKLIVVDDKTGKEIKLDKDIKKEPKDKVIKNMEKKGKEFYISCISMGNPHAVIEVEDLENFPVEEYGRKIENASIFPNKTNVEFIKVEDENNIRMRVWERGTGETLACGTGACAVVVASILKKKVNRKVNVKLLGGKLEIEWKDDNHVYMKGSANTVFEGKINKLL